MTAVDRILTALEAHGRRVRRTGTGGTAQCPAHDDRNPSLSISTGDDGRALVNCHGGCDTRDVLTALDLQPTDLFPDERPTDGPGPVVATYTYTDRDGRPVLRVNRHSPKTFRQQANQGGTWVNTLKGLTAEQRQLPYRLPEILQAIDDDLDIYVVEGEKDADAMWAHGHPATCNAGGAGKWTDGHTSWLTDARHVVIVADRDQAGLDHAKRVSSSLLMFGVPWSIVTAAEPHKDPHDHLATGLGPEDFTPLDDTVDVALDDPEPVETHGWEPVDLTPLLDSRYEPPRPDLLALPDGRHLFYSGRVNALIGESGAGKSWVSQLLVAQVLIAGGLALVIDLEDHAGSYVDRLRRLGVPDAAIIERFVYISPDAPLSDAARAALVELVEQRAFDVVVIDSTGEAMALDAAKPNDDDDTARWFRRFPRTIANLGPGVVILDHLPKDPNRPGGFAIGSQRKRAAIDGALFEVKALSAPVKGRTGRLRLVCGKDRSGFWKHHEDVCDVVVEDVGERIRVELEDCDNRKGPTMKMEAVSRFLEENGPSSMRQIEDGVKGQREIIRQAALRLAADGYATKTTQSGKGGGFRFVITAPYRRDLADLGLTSPTSPQPPPVPEGRGSDGDPFLTSPTSPPPRNGEGGEGEVRNASAGHGEGSNPRTSPPFTDTTYTTPDPTTLEDF